MAERNRKLNIKDIRKVVKFLLKNKSHCLFCNKNPLVLKKVEDINSGKRNVIFFDTYFLCDRHKNISITSEEIVKHMYFLKDQTF